VAVQREFDLKKCRLSREERERERERERGRRQKL